MQRERSQGLRVDFPLAVDIAEGAGPGHQRQHHQAQNASSGCTRPWACRGSGTKARV